MRVAFISRATMHSAPGGDTKQLLQTAECLRALGVAVDVFRTDETIAYAQYDLLHFFNIIRPADILVHTTNTNVPYVVSTIFVEYDVLPGSRGLKTLVQRLVGNDRMEWIKAVARWLVNGEKIRSRRYLLGGHRAAVKAVARGAAMLLPNSESEYRRFVRQYSLERPYRVVPNGIDKAAVGRGYGKLPDYDNAVLCMGRIEPLKNQLRLIEAMNGSPYRLFIHGKASPNHQAYYEACVAAAADNVSIGGWLEGDDLYAAYASARVHVLPSFFETTGLSSLEAAVMGCNIVVSPGGDTRDYFGRDAWYCSPENPASIRAAVDAAFAAPYNAAFRERILRQYTWERAAAETLNAYKALLH